MIKAVAKSDIPQIELPAEVISFSGSSDSGWLTLLDQTQLPTLKAFIDCKTMQDAWDAIKRLSVRGAPAIGVAAAYAMVLAAREAKAESVSSGRKFNDCLNEKAQYLKSCRPTAVNLAWAVDRVMAAVKSVDAASVGARILTEAKKIHREDYNMCMEIGRWAAPLVESCKGVLTHCNAGALATAGIGTATAGMYVAHARNHAFCVYCDETRPLLQGSRLTAWELSHAGINAVVITDNMAAQIMKEGRVQMVIVGADRIAANGDAANKIGTYGLAILAKQHEIPFYIAAPVSTFDMELKSGDQIPIEQRGSEEITDFFGRRTAPDAIAVYAPAFDVTPAGLITGIITDRGIIDPVNAANVRDMILA